MNETDQLSLPTSSHAYGIGLIAIIVGSGIGVVYYQMYYIPEYNAKPHFDDPRILSPGQTTNIAIVSGSSIQGNPQYFVPAKQPVQLGVNNLVIWQNNDEAGHYVTIDPTSNYNDRYSGNLDSPVIMPGKSFSFLFTQEGTVKYYCKVHTWMTGEIDVVPGAKTS